MIAPQLVMEQMLQEIGGDAAGTAPSIRDPTDRDFVTSPAALLVVCGRTPDDLLPVLDVALSQRFAAVPARHLMAGLLEPLKKAVGNAWKWGNRKDPARQVRVQVVATLLGAVIAVTDEGRGFDVAARLEKLRDGKPYFTHGGSGFARFAQSPSLVTWADGGRTVLIRFLCVPEPGAPLEPGARAAWGAAADESAMIDLLSGSMSEYRDGSAVIEACRVCAPPGQPSDSPQVSYHLRAQHRGTGRGFLQVLTGLRCAAPPAEVQAVAAELRRMLRDGTIAVPEPVATIADPPVVVWRFNPQLNLRQYLKEAPDPLLVEELAESVGAFLRKFHAASLHPPECETWDGALGRVTVAVKRAAERLPPGKRRHERAAELLDALAGRGSSVPWAPTAPIHGNFGWKQVVRSDDRFYLSDLDACRLSHPGLDVGGFLADLARFCLLGKDADPGRHRRARARFLAAYGADDPPAWIAQADFFEALGLAARLDRLAERHDKPQKLDDVVDRVRSLL